MAYYILGVHEKYKKCLCKDYKNYLICTRTRNIKFLFSMVQALSYETFSVIEGGDGV